MPARLCPVQDVQAASFNLPTTYSARPKHKEMKGIKSITLLRIVSSPPLPRHQFHCHQSNESNKECLPCRGKQSKPSIVSTVKQTASKFQSSVLTLTRLQAGHLHSSTYSQCPARPSPHSSPTFRANCPKRMAVNGSRLVVVTNWPMNRAMMDPFATYCIQLQLEKLLLSDI
jgi:hypothetical protein